MPRRPGLLLLRALACLAAGGCASVDPRPDYERARGAILAATGAAEVHDPLGPVLSGEEIDAVLADGLDLAEATRLALLNNRRLQAGFHSLGVARAELVQAGLPDNPRLSLSLLFPDAGGRLRWTADLLGSLDELRWIPARQEAARAGLEERILDLSRLAVELVAATRSAYLQGVAARETRAVAREELELAHRSLQGVRRLVEAGAATRLEEGLAESRALGAELAFQGTERAETGALRRLAALLSIEQDLLAVSLTDPLPDPAWRAPEREVLVARSLEARADVRAAHRAVAAAAARLELERRRVPGFAAGVSVERPEAGASTDLLVGPSASLELPVFDRNRAGVIRAEHDLARLEKEREALVAEVRQEVRAALDTAEAASRAATFATDRLVPRARSATALAERAHELGETTVLTFLQARGAALEARRAEIGARLEAALARVGLERAAGFPLDSPRAGGVPPVR